MPITEAQVLEAAENVATITKRYFAELHMPPVDVPPDAPPEGHPVDVPPDVPPVDTPPDLPPVDVPPDLPPVDTPPDVPPDLPPVDLPPVDPPVEVPPVPAFTPQIVTADRFLITDGPAWDPMMAYDSSCNNIGPYGGWVEWPKAPADSPYKNASDWVDAQGTRRGSTPYASAKVGPLTIVDVMPLCKPGQALQFVLRNRTTPASTFNAVLFNSRESQSAPPFIAVTYDDGSTDKLACLADAEANSTTSTSIGGSAVCTVADNSLVYMRFATPARACVKAELVLSTIKTYGSAPQVHVFGVTPPWAAPDPSFATLVGDPHQVFFSESLGPDQFPSSYDKKIGNQYDNITQVMTDQGLAMSTWMDPRWQGVLDMSVCLSTEDGIDALHAAFEYDLFVCETFAPLQGGKMPGWASATLPDDALRKLPGVPIGRNGTLKVGNGGRKATGCDGWSLRSGHGWRLPPGHPLADQIMLDTYAYHADMLGLYGDSWQWTQHSPLTLQIGRWHRIYQRLKVNDPGIRNGVLECRIDGQLAFLKTDVYLRSEVSWDNQLQWMDPYSKKIYTTITQGGIGKVWLNEFHGGKLRPPEPRFEAFRHRNLRVSKYA